MSQKVIFFNWCITTTTTMTNVTKWSGVYTYMSLHRYLYTVTHLCLHLTQFGLLSKPSTGSVLHSLWFVRLEGNHVLQAEQPQKLHSEGCRKSSTTNTQINVTWFANVFCDSQMCHATHKRISWFTYKCHIIHKCKGCYIYLLFPICDHPYLTFLTWLDSQMHIFQKDILCCQSDVS